MADLKIGREDLRPEEFLEPPADVAMRLGHMPRTELRRRFTVPAQWLRFGKSHTGIPPSVPT